VFRKPIAMPYANASCLGFLSTDIDIPSGTQSGGHDGPAGRCYSCFISIEPTLPAKGIVEHGSAAREVVALRYSRPVNR
jgi:hypothetical protein